MNEGFGKDFYRKGNSVKRFGPFAERPDSENTPNSDHGLSFPSPETQTMV